MAPVLAGAILGWWFFDWRGTVLFGGIALAVALAGARIARRRPGLASGLILLAAAVLFHQSSTLTWGGADVPDGSRYKASPVGLSHVLTPNRTVSETIDCGWYDVSGYPTRCEVASSAAFSRLRLAYPLVILAALLCVALAGMSLHPRGPLHPLQRAGAAASMVAALAAAPLFSGNLGSALAALTGLAAGLGGTLAVMQLLVGILLCLVLVTSLSPRPGTNRH